MTTMSLPMVGKPAPDFSLPSTAGEEVTLSSFQGKSHVVLAFFPLAFTSVCTEEMGCFTDDFAAFEGVDAKVFGISVDAVPALKEFKAKHGFAIDFLSDFKRDVCRSYGTLTVGLRGGRIRRPPGQRRAARSAAGTSVGMG